MFQQYIAQSGSATAIWAIDYTNKYAVDEIGKLLGCPPDVDGLTLCLQTADVLELLRAHSQFQVKNYKLIKDK
jgi:hypothetical protein